MIDPYKSPAASLVDLDRLDSILDTKRLLLSFRGRIGRRHFWLGFVVFLALDIFLFAGLYFWSSSWLLAQLMSIPTLYILFAVTAKRYHDQNKSGWHALIWLAPFVGWVFVVIECGFWKGSLMRNQYGQPLVGPLAESLRK